MDKLLEQFAWDIHKNWKPRIKKDDWEINNNWRHLGNFAFGYCLYYPYSVDDERKDVYFNLHHNKNIGISVYSNNRSNRSDEHSKIILNQLLPFLETTDFDGFVIFQDECFGNSSYYPIGKNAKMIKKLTDLLKEHFDTKPYSYLHMSGKGSTFHKYHEVMPIISEDIVGLKVQLSYRKSLFLTSEKDIFELKNRLDEKMTHVPEMKKEIAELALSFDKNSYFNEEKEYVFVYNKRIPFLTEVTFSGIYKGRVFYQTIMHENFDEFKKMALEHAKSYLKKNRLRSIVNGEVYDIFHQFYFKIFHRHSKNAVGMLKTYVFTSMDKQELLNMVEPNYSKEKVPLDDSMIDLFLQKVRKYHKPIKNTIKEAFELGELYVFRSSTCAFIEKKETVLNSYFIKIS